jgi:transketolase
VNLGVAEANMLSVAAGLALSGKRPFVYSIAPFATVRCLEQIRNDVCNMGAAVVVVGVGGGYAYGSNGATHHGVDDIAVTRAMAGMTVTCPCDPWETARLVEALAKRDGPAYLRLSRAGEPNLSRSDAVFELGRPAVLRSGSRVAILASGPVAAEALLAAESLRQHKVDPLVLSIHTIKPLGGLGEILREHACELVVTVEEHGPHGGLHEAVAAELAGDAQRPRIERLSGPDAPVHTAGSQAYLRRALGLDAEGIRARIAARLAP